MLLRGLLLLQEHAHRLGARREGLVQAFLNSVQAQLAAPSAAPGWQGLQLHAAPHLAMAGTANAGHYRADELASGEHATAPSLFALMASAGGARTLLEPWLASSSRGKTGSSSGGGNCSVPPPPTLPWLPPWSLPTDSPAFMPANSGRDAQRWLTLGSGAGSMSQGSEAEVAAPATPPKQPHGQGWGPGAGALTGAPSDVADPSLSMDISAPASPTAAQPQPAVQPTGGQAELAGDAQRSGPWEAAGEAGVLGAAAAEAQGEASEGLQAWHGAVSEGMLWWQKNLQHGGMANAWTPTGSKSTDGDAVSMHQLRAALLPSLVHQGHKTDRRSVPQQRHNGQTGGQHSVTVNAGCGLAGTAPSAQQQASHQLGWLLEGCSSTGGSPPPIELLLQNSLLPMLSSRIEDINQQLLACMLSDWGLMAELVQMRNFYLLASPAMQAWADWLLSSLLRGKMVEEYQEHELEAALQEAMASCVEGDAPLPPLDCMSVTIDRKRAARARDRQVEAARKTTASFSTAPQPQSSDGGAHPSERKQNHCLAELDGLQLRCQPTFLMSMIGGAHAMDSYGHAMVFLLQIQLAKLALESARQRSWKLMQRHVRQQRSSSVDGKAPAFGVLDVMYNQPAATAGPGRAGSRPGTDGGLGGSSAVLLGRKAEEAMQQEMVNFVTNLHHFVLDRLLLNAWVQLERVSWQAPALNVLHCQDAAQAKTGLHCFKSSEADRRALKPLAGPSYSQEPGRGCDPA